jgi:(2Fe-2S) ferredoxin
METPDRCVRICQHRSCRKLGAATVLAEFQKQSVAEVQACECLGRCGNGPMVLVLPDQVWYCRVLPAEVAAIVDRHLVGGVPVEAMRDRPPS